MLTNYYNVDENQSVGAFLKEVKEKKNTNYIILDTQPPSFVNARDIALRTHSTEDKLKLFKKPLPRTEANKKHEQLQFLIETGEQIVKTSYGFFDYLQGLEIIKREKPSFLKNKLETEQKKQIYALNENDKLSTAKQLLVDHKINILPVINEELNVIGEIRTIDLLISNIYDREISREYFSDKSHKTLLNAQISNFMNEYPLTLKSSQTLFDAVEMMINKKLPSIIVVNSEQIFSIISHKDIFNLYRSESKQKEYSVEISGIKNLYEDEKSLIRTFANRTAEKLAKRTQYNEIKLVFKTHGPEESGHLKKGIMTANAFAGNKVISVQKEISPGTSDGEVNDKQKGDWNIPKLTQETLRALEESVSKAK